MFAAIASLRAASAPCGCADPLADRATSTTADKVVFMRPPRVAAHSSPSAAAAGSDKQRRRAVVSHFGARTRLPGDLRTDDPALGAGHPKNLIVKRRPARVEPQALEHLLGHHPPDRVVM